MRPVRPTGETLLRREIAHLRELLYVELAARDHALQMQAREYERRLETLNHENARILAAGDKALSNEKFDGFSKGYDEWKRSVDRYMASNEGGLATATSRDTRVRSTIVVAIGVCTLVLSLVVALANGIIR